MSYQSVPASGGGLPATTLAGYFLRDDSTWQPIAGGGDALVANPLSQFASTTSAQFAGVISNKTGTGVLVFATSPTLVTPVLGVATVTTVNKVTITAPATSATLTIADGATLTASTTATVSGTNTGDQTLSDATISTSDITTNNFTTAKHGFVPKGTNVGSFLKDDGTWAAIPGGGDALTSNPLSQFATTTPAQLAAVLAGGVTGTGNFVQATSPTLVTPALGVASGTSFNKITITSPATGATLTIVDGKTLTVSNNATVSGTNTGDQATTGRIVSFQVLNSGTTYTRPAGVGPGIVEGWGGGGGGGGCAATSAGQCSLAVGGGSGGYFRHFYATLPSSGTYAIGAAGTAGNNAGAAAGDGGDTTFTDGSTLLTAKGGKGAPAGLGTAAATGVLAGAQGGAIATNANLVVAGGTSGSAGIRTGTGGANTSCSGSGGGQFGGGLRGTSGAGIDATGPAGGGGGALGLASGAAVIGGAGFSGLIIVWEMGA